MSFSIQQFVQFGLKRAIPELLPNKGRQLELGPGTNPCPEATEFLEYPNWNADRDLIPYPTESVDVIHAYNILEHVRNPIFVLREIDRVLVVGGHVNITVPHALVELAHCDLDHKHTFTEETWKNTFNNFGYEKHRDEPWSLQVHANFLCGVAHRNLCIFTQLVKVEL